MGSKVLKDLKISFKISNVAEDIKSSIQDIKLPRTNEPIINYILKFILTRVIEEVLKIIQALSI